MSLAIKYGNLDDCNLRLAGSVVSYKEEPVYITDVMRGQGDEVFRVYVKDLPSNEVGGDDIFERARLRVEDQIQKRGRRFILSNDVDISPFKLGYVNDKTTAFFATRQPYRMQRQGLHSENFEARTHDGHKISFTHFLASVGLLDMYHNKYPTFEEALKKLSKQLPSVAFSREFCVERDPVVPDIQNLYFKATKVGVVMNGGVVLGTKYLCLNEMLEEAKRKR